VGIEVYRKLRGLFDQLPHAVIIEGAYLLLHGGVPEGVKSAYDMARAREVHPQKPWLAQILWSDPGEIRGSFASPRGAGRIFGPDVTSRVLNLLGVRVLIRSHEPCDGVAPSHGGQVLTLFSRKGPPYFNERAAYLMIDLEESPKDAYELASRAKKF
jgi:protein phosphatase